VTDFDAEQFEAELRTLKGARPPQATLDRILTELGTQSKRKRAPAAEPAQVCLWRSVLRWVVPAACAALIALWYAAGHQHSAKPKTGIQPIASTGRPLLRADKVEIDRQLVADFDAVARLPGGEPVRFRCQQWMDKVRLRDTAAGLVIERTTPRLEIVPVRFETY
jgi:hypothetical protein